MIFYIAKVILYVTVLLILFSPVLILSFFILLLLILLFLWLFELLGKSLFKFPNIVKILSFSTILNFSCPSSFGEVIIKENLQENIYLSLFNFKLGKRYFSFCTKKIGEENSRFYFFNCTCLENIQSLPDYKKIDIKYDKYSDFLNSDMKRKNLASYKEMFSIYQERVQNTRSSTENKINLYMAITAIVLSSQLALIPFKKDNFDNIFYWLILISLIYQYVNLILFIFEYIKVKAVKEISIETSIKSADAEKKLLLMQYYNYMVERESNTFNITLLKNIEKYIWCILGMSLFIFIFKLKG